MRAAGTLPLFVWAALLLAGCEKNHGKTDQGGASASEGTVIGATTEQTKPAADWSASDILKRLLASYRQAKTYRDSAVVRLAFRQNGQLVSQEQPFAVAY